MLEINKKCLQRYALCFHFIMRVALINVYFITTIGANDDAIKFHRVAMTLAQNQYGLNFGIGADFIRTFLAFFYKYLGPSLLLGEELSILSFCFHVLYLSKFINYSGILSTLHCYF